MCGIAGYTGTARPGLIDRMMADVRSRGPDGEGRYSRDGVHFGHTRLAIVDLPGGGQPMTRVGGRYTVCYNGEIYNYAELRAEIEAAGHVFSTTCDTELIPLGFAVHSESFFARLNGMFAFALHDALTGALYLVRDHFGIKPVYVARAGADIVFASSARAVARHPMVDRSIDPTAVREFLQYRYIPSGRHFFAGATQIPPGSFLKWTANGVVERPFWQPKRRTGTATAAAADIVPRLRALIEDSVARQLRADVPVGVLLSGGVDSALVARLAARHAQAPLAAFTFAIGGRHDESEAARQIATECGMDHHVTRLSTGDFSKFPGIVAAMDSPIGDAIVLPTSLLCQTAATRVKAVLTGEGADELFGGYVHFPVLRRLGALGAACPGLARLAPLLRLVPVPLLDLFFRYPASLGRLGRARIASLLAAIGDSGRLASRAAQAIDDDEIRSGTALQPMSDRAPADLSLAGMMHDFVRTWLPCQILHKIDQLSMAYGLEARVPYVDFRIYELLLEAGDDLFLSGRTDKVALRQAAAADGLTSAYRPKAAFYLPLERLWAREVESLCRDWLSAAEIARHGILRRPFVETCLADFRAGEFLAAKKLVAMASLHIWLDSNGRA